MKEILSLTKVRLPFESDYNLIGSQNVTKHPFPQNIHFIPRWKMK